MKLSVYHCYTCDGSVYGVAAYTASEARAFLHARLRVDGSTTTIAKVENVGAPKATTGLGSWEFGTVLCYSGPIIEPGAS